MIGHAPIRLILARHGNTFEAGEVPVQVGARTDKALTTHGREQAGRLAEYLKSTGITPTAIYAGTLKRQIETAQIVAGKFHAADRLHLNESALTEIDYGQWEGLTSEAISTQWPKEYENWTAQAHWPQRIFGKSEKEHIEAIEKWLNALRHQYASHDTVVGVTSNGIIRYFYALDGKEWERMAHERQMDALKVKTGNFCELFLFKDGLKVNRWNENC